MGLKDVGAKLPPGFRFHPSDEELVCHYLRNKIKAKSDHYEDGGDDDEDEALKTGDLVEIDLHICEPWQLPEVAKLNANEWYFFSFRDRKYATGYRTNRATTSGYWKATGKDRTVVDPRTKEMVGMRKTLVFYKNRAPNGIKTSWIMHEFRLERPSMPPKEDWVLCRIFNKSKTAVAQDNNNITMNIPKFSIENEDSMFDFNYTNLAPPLPHSISSSLSPPSINTTVDLYHRRHHHHHHHHHLMMKMGCGPSDQLIMSSSSSLGQGESLLNMVGATEDDGYGNMFWEMMSLEKTGGMGSDGVVSHLEDDDLGFEIDNTIAFQ